LLALLPATAVIDISPPKRERHPVTRLTVLDGEQAQEGTSHNAFEQLAFQLS
jgi:hypothetical protein